MTAMGFLQPEFARRLLVPSSGAPEGIRSGAAPDHERRFAVHRNNVVVSLVDALAETFPVTLALVGEEFFRAMARERVLADPPRSPVLTDYAQGFPGFIEAFAPAAGVAYLADVARLEALRVRAWHAADAEPLADTTYNDLLAVPERLATVRLVLHPASQWLRSRYAVHSIWLAHQGLDRLETANLKGIYTGAPEDVLIVRPALDVVVAPLPSGAIAFLDALRNGIPLLRAFNAAQAAASDVDGGVLFSLLICHGLAVAVENQPEP
ncbi:MAG: DNA-binding domain-containing protein [Pseudomonadota bacterium]|nr:DNA-binding domain-containing protein [Pseudomonadota bacterium]